MSNYPPGVLESDIDALYFEEYIDQMDDYFKEATNAEFGSD